MSIDLTPRTIVERLIAKWCDRSWPGTTDTFVAVYRFKKIQWCTAAWTIVDAVSAKDRSVRYKHLLRIASVLAEADVPTKGKKAEYYTVAMSGVGVLLDQVLGSGDVG